MTTRYQLTMTAFITVDAAPTTDAAHDIDWQEVAECHEDTIKALIAERDEAEHELRVSEKLRRDTEAFAALWKEVTRYQLGKIADRDDAHASCEWNRLELVHRAEKAEDALEDLHKLYATAVRERGEREANEQDQARRAEKAEQEGRRRVRKFDDDWDTCTCGYDAWPCRSQEPTDSARGAQEKIARVYALHLPAGSPAVCQHCNGSQGTHPAYPCETIRALTPEEPA